MNPELSLVCKKLPSKKIKNYREMITASLFRQSVRINGPRISSISAEDLNIIYDLYDKTFFGSKLKNLGYSINFSLSRRMTKSAGKTIFLNPAKSNESAGLGSYEIRMGVDFFLNFEMIKGKKQVCGIETDNSLEALLLVFEHELCHVLEWANFGDSDCSKDRFKTMASNLFGHRASHHQLPTHRQIAYECLNLKAGDAVTFNFEGQQLVGFIEKINKRATVMAKNKNGNYQDNEGNRYNKFYVPIKLLKKKSI